MVFLKEGEYRGLNMGLGDIGIIIGKAKREHSSKGVQIDTSIHEHVLDLLFSSAGRGKDDGTIGPKPKFVKVKMGIHSSGQNYKLTW